MSRAAEERRALREGRDLIVAKVFDVTESSIHGRQEHLIPEFVDGLRRRRSRPAAPCPVPEDIPGGMVARPYNSVEGPSAFGQPDEVRREAANADSERSRPTVLHLRVSPIPASAARSLLVSGHYLRSMPAGTQLAFGVFAGASLAGALTLGGGPKNAHRLMQDAGPDDCLTLTRLWLDDRLPRNAASRVLGLVVRALRRHTSLLFVLTYADPARGHAGTIYQAANWLYTGLSEGTPLYDLGDGIPHHSRSLGHAYGTRSLAYLRAQGIDVRLVAQGRKHRYVYPLNRSVRERLTVPILPYPKREAPDGDR